MASKPTAKKKLNMNSITVAIIPEVVLPLEIVPANIAMQEHMPMHANSISLRRPKRSMIQIGGSEDTKYATPLKPARSRERLYDNPTLLWKMLGA